MTERQDKYTQTNKKSTIYSDFLMNLNPHPFTHDLARATNEEAVKRSIRNLILTNSFERPFKPKLGGNIHKFLFEPMTIDTQKSIEEAIALTIRNYEVRANLIGLIVTPDEINQVYNISIVFNVVNNANPVELSMQLNRIR